MKLKIPKPISAGIILSYKCSSQCKHCLYYSSPLWKGDWMEEELLTETLEILSTLVKRSSFLSFNYGVHLSGGEPFLNFELLLKAVKIAKKLKISPILVETNAVWCLREDLSLEKLRTLKEVGLDGILISVNPFLLEYVPFKRTKLAIDCAFRIFSEGVLIYQEVFYHEFKRLNIEETLPLKNYLEKSGYGLYFAELLPMGRACYELSFLFKKYPPEVFFGKNCKAELLSPYHVHVDNYGNYLTGFCAGLSLGHITELKSLVEEGINLKKKPLLDLLLQDIKLFYQMAVKEFGYQPPEEGFISKCHLCLDIRRFLVSKGANFQELVPKEYYQVS
ncbi:MAG: radical SAM protein [Thermodesulfobacterium sp.]|nr:radical SAM protein [Thermodesulfobacterium sp.]